MDIFKPKSLWRIGREYLISLLQSFIVILMIIAVTYVICIAYSFPLFEIPYKVTLPTVLILNAISIIMMNYNYIIYRYYIKLNYLACSILNLENILTNGGLNKFKLYYDYSNDIIYVYCRSKEDLMGAKCLLSEYLKS